MCAQQIPQGDLLKSMLRYPLVAVFLGCVSFPFHILKI